MQSKYNVSVGSAPPADFRWVSRRKVLPVAVSVAIGVLVHAGDAKAGGTTKLTGPSQQSVVSTDETGTTYSVNEGASLAVGSTGVIGDENASVHQVQDTASMSVAGGGAVLGGIDATQLSTLNLGVGAVGAPAVVRGGGDVLESGRLVWVSASSANFDNVSIQAVPTSVNGQGATVVLVTDGGALVTTGKTIIDGSSVAYGVMGTQETTQITINGSQVSGGVAAVSSLDAMVNASGATLVGGVVGAEAQLGGVLGLHGTKVQGQGQVLAGQDSAGVLIISTPDGGSANAPRPTTLVVDQNSSITGLGGSAGLKVGLGGEAALVSVADSSITGGGLGIDISAANGYDPRGGAAQVALDHTVVSAGQEAIRVDGAGVVASLDARNGTTMNAGNGVLLSASGGSQVEFTVDHSSLVGDVLADAASTGVLNLQNNASLTGRIAGFDTGIDASSQWTMDASSTVGSLNLNGAVTFAPPASPGAFKILTVQNDLSGTGGTVALNTTLNAGGALASQATDRLLVQGSVTTTGPTVLDIAPLGAGASTTVNSGPAGRPNPDEGISVVQVAGASRSDAFVLRGGYVAAGPWQYGLKAFGPQSGNGSADPAQSALASGDVNWDYRLATRYVDAQGQTVVGDGDGVAGGGVSEGGGQSWRVAVVPQLPAYLSLQTAMAGYLFDSTGALHQRLGEIRNDSLDQPGQYQGDAFARVFGATGDYRSNVSFQQVGTDFSSEYQGVQLGGNFYRDQGVNGTLRLGVAAIHASGHFDTDTPDGASRTSFNDTGLALTGTWQHASGFYVDAVLRADRLQADVTTPSRGDVGGTSGWGWVSSVETGMPLMLTRTVFVEPQAQLAWVGSTFHGLTDADNVAVQFDHDNNLIGRLGARLGVDLTDGTKHCTPYIKGDLLWGGGGSPRVLADGVSFEGGRYGQAWQTSAGLDAKLGARLDLVLNVGYQHSFAGNGFSGWNATGNLRMKF